MNFVSVAIIAAMFATCGSPQQKPKRKTRVVVVHKSDERAIDRAIARTLRDQ